MRLICGPEPVTYGGDTTTAAYMLKDISEIVYDSSKTPSFACGIGGCAGTFSGSIRIFFKKFDTSNLAASTLQCSSVSAYESLTNALFGEGFFFGDTHWNTDYIEITSTKVSESTYDYENRKPEGAFQALAEINNSLNKLVMASRGGQSAWQAPSGACASELEGAEEVDAKWGSLKIVDEKKVQLPRDYAPLADGERVVASQSNMYMMNLKDWLLSFFTCGLYFICVVGDKRKIRPALVLTNYRLMEICPSVDNACLAFCPKIIADCCFPVLRGFVVRSLYPRHVYSGVLSREKFSVTATICTDAGAVSVTFDQVPSGTMGDGLNAETKFRRKLYFCHALMSSATRRAHFKPGEEEVLELTKEEKALFPFAEGEVPLARYAGNVADSVGPCCTKRFSWHPGCCLACTCGVKPMFSEGSMTLTTQTLFGALKSLVRCCFIQTVCRVFYFLFRARLLSAVFQEKTNRPFACWGICMPFVKKHDWQLMWAPLHHVMSTAVDTSLIGRDNCFTRSCEGNFFGKNCCPLNKSVLTVGLKAKTSPAGDGLLAPEVSNIHMFKSLRTDSEVTAFREQIARVQTHLTAVGPAINNVDYLPSAPVVGVMAQQMEDDKGSRI
jgi:hypothetical protein